ncbi:uncharacterized protein RAG0_16640 [Rhynchosporium agropyri]|uniref:Rhodopsin domain-containing protein n=1 Tax=Rhynchosporium agropyri TaxID=914238 RepID=A0A1E1LT34_9HELO|nr:uncharacterized protein RAG0_16640 [Rhynchosporium agropyri]
MDALSVVWACCSLAVVIMLARLVMGRYCKTKWDSGDSLTAVAIVCVCILIAFTHVLIIWGTSNVADEYRKTHHFTQREILEREMGSKFTLVARVFYVILLWIQKTVLLMFYRHLVRDMSWGSVTMNVFGCMFALTFSASMISTFVECRPFHLYWQVIPDPGNCSQAIAQLYIVGVSNMFTDLMLIFLPLPILVKVRLSIFKKLQLGFLFSIGFMIIIITAIRIPLTVGSKASETFRITWTTGEFLAATFVANAPKFYSFRHLVQRRNSTSLGNVDRTRPNIPQMDDMETAAVSITEVAAIGMKQSDSSHNSRSVDQSVNTTGRGADRPALSEGPG